ncbi:MAG: preprotein translocase subunit SecG [Helicobacteraceae bacterium]|nr:preprotein translocase subunit SecG [Helicobacteraceae bacterium]
MTSILLITQIILAIIITISVLLQKSSSIGLGVYSGSNESLFGAKGPAGFMAKFTMIIGLIFIINTIALGYFYSKETNKSIIDNVKIESNATKPASKIPANPLDNFNAPSAPSPFGQKETPKAP